MPVYFDSTDSNAKYFDLKAVKFLANILAY